MRVIEFEFDLGDLGKNWAEVLFRPKGSLGDSGFEIVQVNFHSLDDELVLEILNNPETEVHQDLMKEIEEKEWEQTETEEEKCQN